MSVTSEERLEIERAFRDRMMSDIANGDFQIHGMKWDTILAGIRNLDQLGPRSTTEQRIEEIVRLRAAEARVGDLEAERQHILTCINLYGDEVLHSALDAAGLLMDGREGQK